VELQGEALSYTVFYTQSKEAFILFKVEDVPLDFEINFSSSRRKTQG